MNEIEKEFVQSIEQAVQITLYWNMRSRHCSLEQEAAEEPRVQMALAQYARKALRIFTKYKVELLTSPDAHVRMCATSCANHPLLNGLEYEP